MKKHGKTNTKKFIFYTGDLCGIAIRAVLGTLQIGGMGYGKLGGLSIDEIIFHLKIPLDGTNMEVVTDGENRCVPIAIVMSLMMTAFLLGMKNKKKATITSMFLVMSLSIGATLSAVYNMYVELDVANYLKNQKTESEFIQENYVDPRDVSITFPEKKEFDLYLS